MRFIIKIILSALAVVFLSWLLPGVEIQDGFVYALLIAAVIGVLNAIVRPILIFLTLPATLVTLGLFLLVINAAMIMLADWMLDSFAVRNFWWALLFSLLLSAINSLVSDSLKKDKKAVEVKKRVVLYDKDGNPIS